MEKILNKILNGDFINEFELKKVCENRLMFGIALDKTELIVTDFDGKIFLIDF
ncbi:MAG: hypothetical protein ACRCZ0_08705 [Cetobacterium sp.]